MTQQVETPAIEVSRCAAAGLPAPGRSVTGRKVRLAALPSAVPWARLVLRHMLREWQLERLSDPTLLLTSELVTNAVQASARPPWYDPGTLPMIELSLRVTDTSLLTEVWDASPALPVLQAADLTGECGRGLLLVDFLADAWGHRAADNGKVVWCEVALPA